MNGYFVLDACGEPIEEKDFTTWTRWFEQADRSVARTAVTAEVTVLTTFSGFDHGAQGGVPRLFETRVLGGVLDGEETRQASKAEALRAHAALVTWCRVGASANWGVTAADIK